MKLALLSNGIPPFTTGGMQTHSLTMVKQLAKRGWSVDVYYPASFNAWKSTQLNGTLPFDSSDEITQHRFAPPSSLISPSPGAGNRALSHQYLRRYLAYSDVDVIYAKGLMAHAFLNAREKHNISLPTIITDIQDYGSFQRPDGLREYIRRAVLRRSYKRVLTHSDVVVSGEHQMPEALARAMSKSNRRVLRLPPVAGDDVDAGEQLHQRLHSLVPESALVHRAA